jgi:iron complex transport system substrate-binding protein
MTIALGLAWAAAVPVGAAPATAAPAPAAPANAAPTWQVVDDEGHSIRMTHPARRIVALSPGATAMLFAAGGGDRIVGTAHFSVEPAAARRIARIGDAHGFDLERIVALHPDVVVAWSGGASAAQLAPLERAGLVVYRHRVVRLGDVAPAIERLGTLLGTQPTAHAAATALQARIEALRSQHRSAAPPRVLVQVWDRPVYTVGGAQLISDAVEVCGYRNLFGDLRDPAPAVALEAIAARDPDAILALAADPQMARDWLQRWHALPSLRAVQRGALLSFVDARLSRLGPEVVDATEDLCRVLAGANK